MNKLHNGEIYNPMGVDLTEDQFKYLKMLTKYNKTNALQQKKRQKMLKKMFAEIGENCYIEAPFFSNWGAHHVHLGNMVYANFNLTLVDDTHIYIGNNVMFGPNVTVATAGHPVQPKLRKLGLQYNMPVKIGNNVWIGANAVILPGVTIGDNSVIGAGSIVTKDIPENVVAVGNPCKVMRQIGQHDNEYYYRDKKIPAEFLK